MDKLKGIYQGLPVLVTGHTGFKGSWLSIWLHELGAKVIGYSLEPPTKPNNFQLTKLSKRITDVRGDVRDFNRLEQVVKKYKPRAVFHLAAQTIVLTSFEKSKETIDINVGGTINLLEILKRTEHPTTFIGITSDKCYEDKNMIWGYRETDPLGGFDPYSASKGMAEIAISSYRRSFFSPPSFNKHLKSIASVRAGNVIGGGDFADFRIVPDCMKHLMAKEPIIVRNPESVRPWQHVLVPLSGYLWLSAKMIENGETYAEAWNFGPQEHKLITTRSIVEKSIELWGSGKWKHRPVPNPKKETEVLRLNWDKAASKLDWRPAYSWDEGLKETVSWFKNYDAFKEEKGFDMYRACVNQIEAYTQKAKELNIEWAL